MEMLNDLVFQKAIYQLAITFCRKVKNEDVLIYLDGILIDNHTNQDTPIQNQTWKLAGIMVITLMEN